MELNPVLDRPVTTSDKLGLVFRTKNELYHFLTTTGNLKVRIS